MTKFKVFVTNDDPLCMLQCSYMQSIQKDFDSLEDAYEFACDMFTMGFGISLNAWYEEED